MFSIGEGLQEKDVQNRDKARVSLVTFPRIANNRDNNDSCHQKLLKYYGDDACTVLSTVAGP